MKGITGLRAQNNVEKQLVSHENDNLPTIIAEHALSGRILHVEEIEDGHKRRFGVAIRNGLIFVREIQAKETD